MNRVEQKLGASLTRWALIIVGAFIIGGVIVGALSSRLFSTGPTGPGRAAGENASKIRSLRMLRSTSQGRTEGSSLLPESTAVC